MATPDLESRLQYLTNAAHLLAISSPETSAYIMSQRNKLAILNNVILPERQRGHTCGACGHIFLPGQGSSMELTRKASAMKHGKVTKRERRLVTSTVTGTSKDEGSQEKEKQKATGVVERGIRFTCGSCGRYTDISRPAPSLASRSYKGRKRGAVGAVVGVENNRLSSKAPATSSSTAPKQNSGKLSAGASSRKRAKNRKAGLQTLIQQNKPSSSSSGFGLGLSDFMK
ncbi:hypothetical protein MKZ38_000993 [Zalerion maritima]|uniref:Uncharacterized protein n=1 Tax=Zalerion maritima TaxID=339359 RepID=A0AAD5RSH0_9PEZI|nr:hypothetical protein MKZ38_000993 [Zalerion maritima]